MAVYYLNLLDLGFTLYALCHGANELNPLMRSLPIMIAWKVGMMWVLCYMLSILAIRYQVARRGLKICTVIYAAVNVWHIVNTFVGGR